MRITFLIGNGFDVGMGMKSQYKDFYDLYTNPDSQWYPRHDPDLVRFARAIGANKDHWSYFEEKMGQHAWNADPRTPNAVEKLLKKHHHFQEKFYEYLQLEEDQLDFEKNRDMLRLKMTDALLKFYSEDNIPDVEAARKIGKVMIPPEPDKRQRWRFYFICYNYSSVLDRCLEVFPEHKWRTPNTSDKYQLSYPSRLIQERALDDRKTVEDTVEMVLHVHGRVAREGEHPKIRGVNDYPLVMGVNDVSQIWRSELATNKVVQDRMIKSRINDERRIQIAREIIRGSQIVVVYGMALGATDKDWWQEIMRWLNGYPQNPEPAKTQETDKEQVSCLASGWAKLWEKIKQIKGSGKEMTELAAEHETAAGKEEPESQRHLIIYVYDSDYTKLNAGRYSELVRERMKKLKKMCEGQNIPEERIHFVVQKNIFALNLRKKRDESEKDDKRQK